MILRIKQLLLLKIDTIISYCLFLAVATLLSVATFVKFSVDFLGMEAVGLTITAITMLYSPLRKKIPAFLLAYIILSICILSVYLLPLPLHVWLQLPGRSLYQDSINLLTQAGHPVHYHSLSVNAYGTAKTLLAFLPSLGVFLVTATIGNRKLKGLIWIFLTVAVYQAVWGLVQSSSGGEIPHGSYRNRDQFAAFMTFALPIGIACAVYQFIRPKDTPWEWVRFLIFIIASILIFSSGFFTQSRAALPGLIAGISLTILILSNHLGLKRFIILFGLLSLCVASVMQIIDPIPVINRFIGTDPNEDVRWIMFERAVDAYKTFFPLGSGLGTFADIYPAFQPLKTGVTDGFISNAHNDYLELLVETGIIGGSIVLGFLLIYIHNWIKLWQNTDQALHFLKVGAGVGLLAGLFHAFFDFNFHTIPNPLMFAFLAGIFLCKPDYA